ncbi:MAG: hypothetical protein AUJ51_12320 [Elusimicrobia bacterium CG1_02_56_21]|nr:MAG: hypothetical protein AUJ51_12320 [Elusimicrobia bacterium CG1_02_56_21]
MRYILAAALAATFSVRAAAQETVLTREPGLPAWLEDRGTGVPASMFGTYIRKGELVIYPFYEYYYDSDAEYSPAGLGFGIDKDYRGKYTAHEGLIFIGYGLTEDAAVELEAAVITAKQRKAADDPSAMPAELKQGGIGDIEGQFRWRFRREDERRPELFTYFETVFPLQKQKLLIGTPDWEFKLGVGAAKGFGFGTLTARASVEYDRAESKAKLGEMAVEYVKKLSPRFRVHLGVEGAQDEVEGITELQWHWAERSYFKLNNAFGLTSKATDFAPEAGIAFVF